MVLVVRSCTVSSEKRTDGSVDGRRTSVFTMAAASSSSAAPQDQPLDATYMQRILAEIDDTFQFGNRYAIELSHGMMVAPPGQRPNPRV